MHLQKRTGFKVVLQNISIAMAINVSRSFENWLKTVNI